MPKDGAHNAKNLPTTRHPMCSNKTLQDDLDHIPSFLATGNEELGRRGCFLKADSYALRCVSIKNDSDHLPHNPPPCPVHSSHALSISSSTPH